MLHANQSGFTIIELILFLALTGLFFLIAFTGIQTRSGQVQFSDSVRAIQSFHNKLLKDTFNGVNTRDAGIDCSITGDHGPSANINLTGNSEPGQSNCVVMGKVFVPRLNSSTADVYTIVGRFLTRAVDESSPNYLDPENNYIQNMYEADPHILITRLNTTYEMEWGTVHNGYGFTAHLRTYAVGFIRDPASSTVYDIVFLRDIPTPTAGVDAYKILLNPLGTVVPDETRWGGSVTSEFCYQGANGQFAELIASGDTGADSIEVIFDPPYDLRPTGESCGTP